MNFAYFVGGCLGAIAFSNFLKNLSRFSADLSLFSAIVLLTVIAIGLGLALFYEDSEKGLTVWFFGVCAIGLGVMIGAI